MNNSSEIVRSRRLFDVAADAESLKDFGMNLRDWQHEIQRGGVPS